MPCTCPRRLLDHPDEPGEDECGECTRVLRRVPPHSLRWRPLAPPTPGSPGGRIPPSRETTRGSRGRVEASGGSRCAAPLLQCHPVRGAGPRCHPVRGAGPGVIPCAAQRRAERRGDAPQTRDRVRHAVAPCVLAILGRFAPKAGYGTRTAPSVVIARRRMPTKQSSAEGDASGLLPASALPRGRNDGERYGYASALPRSHTLRCRCPA